MLPSRASRQEFIEADFEPMSIFDMLTTVARGDAAGLFVISAIRQDDLARFTAGDAGEAVMRSHVGPVTRRAAFSDSASEGDE